MLNFISYKLRITTECVMPPDVKRTRRIQRYLFQVSFVRAEPGKTYATFVSCLEQNKHITRWLPALGFDLSTV